MTLNKKKVEDENSEINELLRIKMKESELLTAMIN